MHARLRRKGEIFGGDGGKDKLLVKVKGGGKWVGEKGDVFVRLFSRHLEVRLHSPLEFYLKDCF